MSALQIAPFYGANYFFPTKYNVNSNYFNPKTLEKLISITGAGVLDNLSKTNHAFVNNLNREYMIKMVAEVTKNLKVASLIVTPCTFQQVVLDSLQSKAKKYSKVKPIPILHISQLMGLAMGMTYSELGLKQLKVSPTRILKKKLTRNFKAVSHRALTQLQLFS